MIFVKYITYLALLHLGFGKKAVLRAAKSAARSLNELPNLAKFSNWFSSPSTPSLVFSLNPGISQVNCINASKYELILTPLKFPGATITSTVEIDVNFDGEKYLECSMLDGAVKQTVDGLPLLRSLLTSLLPSVRSSSVIKWDESTATLSNDATLEIEFSIPSWFPLSNESAANDGSSIIQSNMEADIQNLLDNIVAHYKNTELNENDS